MTPDVEAAPRKIVQQLKIGNVGWSFSFEALIVGKTTDKFNLEEVELNSYRRSILSRSFVRGRMRIVRLLSARKVDLGPTYQTFRHLYGSLMPLN